MTNARIKNLKFLHCIANNFYSDEKEYYAKDYQKCFPK